MIATPVGAVKLESSKGHAATQKGELQCAPVDWGTETPQLHRPNLPFVVSSAKQIVYSDRYRQLRRAKLPSSTESSLKINGSM